MRILIATASAFALAACSQAEAPEPEVEEPAAEAEASTIVDGGPLAGAYSTVSADGVEASWTLAEDGTFTLETEGEDVVTGTYRNEDGEDGSKFCADPAGDEAGEICFALSVPGDDGSWTATDPDGSVLTVTRAEASAESETES